MSSCSFKCTVAVGVILSAWDLATDCLAAYDFFNMLGDYKERAEFMTNEIASDEPSNFKLDSPLFVNLTAEYEALSAFDKDFVYCDIYAVQADPGSLYNESRNIFWSSLGLIVVSVIVMGMGYHVLCCMLRRGQLKNGQGLTKPREKLWNFLSKTAIQFSEDAPQLVIVWLMIMRVGRLDGFDCQLKLHDCGVAGYCTMEDLMVPVPLNSSLLDIAAYDKILAISFVAGIISVLWNFGSTTLMFITEGLFRMVTLTFAQISFTLLPLAWVVFADGVIPFERVSSTEGIIVVSVCVFLTLCCCCSLGTFMFLVQTNAVGPMVERDVDGQISRVRSNSLYI